MNPPNLLTFDIEEWFQANYRALAGRPGAERDDRLESNAGRLLDICERRGARATFFVLGETAERHPGLVQEIKGRGHEVASHGFHHVLVREQRPIDFAADLKTSAALLERLAGEKIVGFRAPSWSVDRRMGWFFEALGKSGFVYDSSLFPVKTFLFGDGRAGRFPHKIGSILEFPASTFRFSGKRIPFASGFFFRFFPFKVIRNNVRALNRQRRPAMVCLHPREIDPDAPRLALPPRESFIHYLGVRATEGKLDRLLATFRFVSIRDYLRFNPRQ